MELQIDKTTLPADGQLVVFKTDQDEMYEGEFNAEKKVFITENFWHYMWHVQSWEPLNEPKAKEKLDLKRIAKLLTIRRSILFIMLVATIGSLWPESKLFMTGLVFIVWIISMHRDKLLINRIK